MLCLARCTRTDRYPRVLKGGIYLTLAASLLLQLYYFSEYPDIVANHFGSGGMPNGWMSKMANLLTSMAIAIFNSAIFLSIPYILKNVPLKYISFPKRDYWLSPERKQSSIIVMSNWMMFFGLVTNIFLISVFHLVYVANQGSPPKLNENNIFILMSVYLVILVTWLIALFRKFNIKETGDNQE